MATLIVTGGAGYIGSHVVHNLLESGYNVVVIDNLCNSYIECLKRISYLLFGNSDLNHPSVTKRLRFYQVDLKEKKELDEVFRNHSHQLLLGVLHFAGLKSVQESCNEPIMYYSNNVTGSVNLLECMKKYQVHNLIFSSSACVYGKPTVIPITETTNLSAMNPYGDAKISVELLLSDLHQAEPDKWRIVILRYFNPIGAHESGLIGEHPRNAEPNLLPILSQVIHGKRKELHIYGNDYETIDGTPVRDYVHVMDIARGHLAALQKFSGKSGHWVFNLGSGKGHTVLQVVSSFESACGKKVPRVFKERRPGDSPILVADPQLANKELNWFPTKTLFDMCYDFWNWYKHNPNGYLV
eukprot:TRINITY_DN987_c0_g1_i1.p1 TRINITY_DN987_c0_g1~~TRINITY_DN987_c0_g1_i1.p1  ORF type:complete len:364 (-),score=42.63 TRINITY_DN987_c0_g1_i1:52-1113(-)